MKKTLALGLAAAMVLSLGAVAFAADDPVNPVGSISSEAYLYDSDLAAVDLTNPVSSAGYGKTLYYPLLNSGVSDSSEAIAAAEATLADKTAAYNTAAEAHTAAVAAAAENASALEAATASRELAEAVKAAADTWASADETTAEAAEAAYVEALAAFDSEATPEVTSAEAVTASEALVSTAATAESEATTASETADADVATAQTALEAASADVSAAQAALDALADSSFPYVYESDAVHSIKIKQSWEMNGKLVSGVEILKKKAVASTTLAQKYIYFLAITLKPSTSTSSSDLMGLIEMRKSGSFDYEDMQLDVNIEVAFPEATEAVITEDPQIFSEGNGFYGDTEEEFTFEADEDSYFIVNTVGQGKILLSMTTRFDSDVAALYPSANLDFFYGNGATFNKTGELYISADEGSYLYKVGDNGTLVAVNASYDDYEEAFVVKTKSIGEYVVSDTKLTIVSAPSDSSSSSSSTSSTSTNTNNNPATGAAL